MMKVSFLAASVPRPKSGPAPVKNPAKLMRDHREASQIWFRDLLWKAFPSRSEHELALRCARALDVSPRIVRCWLRCEHEPGLKHVTAVMLYAQADVSFRASLRTSPAAPHRVAAALAPGHGHGRGHFFIAAGF